MVERFGLEEEPVLEPRYNIAPTQMVAVIRLDRDTLQRRLFFIKGNLLGLTRDFHAPLHPNA